MAYDIPLVILSILIAICASGLALFVVSRTIVTTGSVMAGGIAMAAAIDGMHYTGMYSMRMPAVIYWNPLLVILSIFIALIASYAALVIAVKLRGTEKRSRQFFASVIMGFAIAGMHYTGMTAATFVYRAGTEITDDRIRLSVHNLGEPITEMDRQNLFTLFHRSSSAEATGERGWGLGLMIVKGIAEAHAGSVPSF